MERKRRLPPSRQRNVESFDEDASVIEFMSYRSAPPPVSKGGVGPDDAMPLFLSDSEEAEEDEEKRKKTNKPALAVVGRGSFLVVAARLRRAATAKN